MADLIQIDVENLTEGMFIFELDIPWDSSGFMFQGFMASTEDLAQLQAKCKWVLVSKSRSVTGLFPPEPVEDARSASKKEKVKEPPKLTLSNLIYLELSEWMPRFTFKLSLKRSIEWLTTRDERRNLELSRSQTRQFLQIPEHQKADHAAEAALFRKKTLRARNKFKDDTSVTPAIVTHIATAELADEYNVAKDSIKQLNSVVGTRLFSDASNSYIMDVVMNETKASVGDIVDSMIRNPDAMRLVEDIKAFDNLSYTHAVDVCVLMIAFGREMHLPKNVLVELGLGGLLHDIGEIKPPNGKQVKVANIAMYSIYLEHVVEGMKLVEKSNYSTIVKSIIAEHHERYDGSGYPNGISNLTRANYGHNFAREEKPKISMYGLMIGIVDTYVSMVGARSNLHPIAPNTAMSYIVKQSGTLFDPTLVDVFSQVIGVYPVGGYVELSTGEIALVIKQNRILRLRPVVQVVTDKNRKHAPPYFLNLMDNISGVSIKKEVVFVNKKEKVAPQAED